ncbi:MAG: TIGR03943 family protein [Ruminococcus sp.]|nr:TIGR03943 family protein [Ruminococcus sp.]
MAAQEEKMTPVYVFTGFLEGGKTTFIQQTLNDPRFNTGERTLVILCEEGEVELDTSAMASKNVTVRSIDGPEELTPENIRRLADEAQAQRIIVEYNGMWQLKDLFNALPEGYGIYQEMCFADANTFFSYDQNMRSLVVDKLQTAELIVFNRYSDSIDMMKLHKICRGVARGINIAYEYTDGRVKYDDIEDPLPFDVNAQHITLEDRDYALWYRDIMEDPKKYDGKEMTFKGLVAVEGAFPKNAFAVGRHVMTCCVEDIQYMAVAADWEKTDTLHTRDWVTVTGKVFFEKSKLYKGKGPVLHVTEVKKAEPPKQEVATFY